MKRIVAAALAALFGSAGAAQAHGPGDSAKDGLKGLLTSSALVVSGRVASVRYLNSQPTAEEPLGIPHTFVTYDISEVARGKFDAKQLTLRFAGGADGRGGVLLDTSSPAFATGQTDILFIRPGVSEECPLVGCVDGRFRIADKAVYNAWGVPVVEAAQRLRVGGKPRFDLNTLELPRPSFEDLVQRPEMKAQIERTMPGMSLEEIKKRYEAEAPKASVVSLGLTPSAQRNADAMGPVASAIERFPAPMTPEAFLAAVRAVGASIPLPAGGQVVSADPGRAFTVKPPAVSAMQAAPGRPLTVDPQEAGSLREGEDGPRDVRPRTAPVVPPSPGVIQPTAPRPLQ
jgi:hypothetical protein